MADKSDKPNVQPLSDLPAGSEATVVALAGGRAFQTRLAVGHGMARRIMVSTRGKKSQSAR